MKADGVFLDNESLAKEVEGLEGQLAADVREFFGDMAEIVPNDFAIRVWFEFAGAQVGVYFLDGNTEATAFGGFFTSRRSLLRHLRGVDWDDARSAALAQAEEMDELLRQADDRPPNIPSSERAAQCYARELADGIAELRSKQPVPPFGLIIARDDIEGLGVEVLKDRPEVVFVIADRMTTGCDILAVLERGVAWSFLEIETAKREAVEQLGPISKAKAERRYLL